MQYPCGVPLRNSSCVIALPVAPNTVFFAFAHREAKEMAQKVALGKLAHAVNEETILRSTCVYALNRSLASFAKPRIEGKATGTWQPRA